MTTVYVLSVSHRHGVNISVHQNQEGALAALARYVAHEWQGEMPEGETIPENEGDAIARYFDGDNEESYGIEECELEA